jgi:ELWxxDGT repeat protein
VYGRELWRSNGTEAGTYKVADIYPGLGESEPLFITLAGQHLFFSADDGVHGRELWALKFYPLYLPLITR